ncbi:MAG: DUF4249 domain-containing protein [Bacteroidales bacterium]|nr:DUF4249 domain-containing protein [Bacteroidales bacterium]
MKRFLIFIALLAAVSCENEIPYDFGEAGPKLMVTGFLYAGTAEQTVHVSLSEGGTVSGVGDATVRCYVNGTLAASASAHSDDKARGAQYHQLPVSFKADFTVGDVVVLEVEAAGHKAFTPELTVPAAPIVEKADTTHTTVTHADWSEEVVRFTVDMTDRKGEDNWYALNLVKEVTGTFSFEDGRPDIPVVRRSYPMISHSSLTDPILLDGNMALTDVDLDIMDYMDYLGDGRFETFSDQLFRDGPARLVFDSSRQYYYPGADSDYLFELLIRSYGVGSDGFVPWPTSDEISLSVEVQVHGCSKDAYLYLRALRTVRSNGYNPVLTEPVTIPGNIIDGIGFVDILNTAAVRIDLPEN